MSFLDGNRQALAKFNRGFLDVFAGAIINNKDKKYSILRSTEGLEVECPDGSSHTLKRFGRIDGFPAEAGFALVLGFGDGSLLRALLAMDRIEHLLLYEPSFAYLERLWELEDFAPVLSDRRLRLIGGDAAALRPALDRYFYEEPFRLTHAFHFVPFTNPGTDAFPGARAAYETFVKAFTDEIAAKLGRIRPNEEDAFWGFLNVLENYPEYGDYPDIAGLAGMFAGKPGVVIASGPSLNAGLDALEKCRERFVVAACDSAAPALARRGIAPDFVATLERVALAQRPLLDLPEREKIPVLAPSVVSPAFLKSYPGPKIGIKLSGGFDDWLTGEPAPDTIGNMASVAHLCFVGLRRMGCDPVCLIGQDLAYDPDTQASHDAHAAQVGHQATEGYRANDGSWQAPVTQTGHDGRPRRTQFLWQHYAAVYGPLVSRYGGKVFNLIPARYGIPVAGTERLDPEEGLRHAAGGAIDASALPVSLKNFSPDGTRRAAVLSKVSSCRGTLRSYQKLSLAAMRALAETWRDHDPAFPKAQVLGFEGVYRDLFDRMETALTGLRELDGAFFDRHFIRLVMNSFLGVRIERNQLRFRETDWVRRHYGLIQNYYKTFNLIQLWSARCLEVLEHHNGKRWRAWE